MQMERVQEHGQGTGSYELEEDCEETVSTETLTTEGQRDWSRRCSIY